MFVGTCACGSPAAGNNIKGGEEPGSSRLWHQPCAANQNQDLSRGCRRSSETLSLSGARSVPVEGCRAWMKGRANAQRELENPHPAFCLFP